MKAKHDSCELNVYMHVAYCAMRVKGKRATPFGTREVLHSVQSYDIKSLHVNKIYDS